jgi:hypothetical protein
MRLSPIENRGSAHLQKVKETAVAGFTRVLAHFSHRSSNERSLRRNVDCDDLSLIASLEVGLIFLPVDLFAGVGYFAWVREFQISGGIHIDLTSRAMTAQFSDDYNLQVSGRFGYPKLQQLSHPVHL